VRVRIAEALYDAEAVLSNPNAFKAEEIRTLRDQITSNLERAWEITGRSEDQLTAHPFTIRAFPFVRSQYFGTVEGKLTLFALCSSAMLFLATADDGLSEN
jgi:hypothetical protein